MNLSIKTKLIDLFKLNKKKLRHKNKNIINLITDFNLIKNVYFKLKNKKETKIRFINHIELKTLKTLNAQIEKGSYKWDDNKFLKSKKIFDFKNRIVQKLIEIILSIIYEPIFKTLEYNYGSRHQKNVQLTIKYLKLQNLRWKYAVKNKIAKKELIHKKVPLTEIVKKKIIDPVFLRARSQMYEVS